MTVRTLQIAAAIAAVAAVAAGDATAQGTPVPPPGESAIHEYVETMPTSRGGAIVGTAKGKGRALPKRVKKRIERTVGRKKAPVLEYIATSPAYGAPEANLPSKARATPNRPAKQGKAAGKGRPGTHATPAAPATPTNPSARPRPQRPVFTPEQVERKDVSTEQVLSTAVQSVGDVSEARIAALFGVLMLISACALGVAAQRRRERGL